MCPFLTPQILKHSFFGPSLLSFSVASKLRTIGTAYWKIQKLFGPSSLQKLLWRLDVVSILHGPLNPVKLPRNLGVSPCPLLASQSVSYAFAQPLWILFQNLRLDVEKFGDLMGIRPRTGSFRVSSLFKANAKGATWQDAFAISFTRACIFSSILCSLAGLLPFFTSNWRQCCGASAAALR